MKLISLNIFGGKWFEPLVAFLKEQRDSTDIFCFQEVFSTSSDRTDAGWGARADVYERISEILTEFTGFFAPGESGFCYEGKADFDLSYGLAVFVRKGLSISTHGNIVAFENRDDDHLYGGLSRNLQYATITQDEKQITIANLHGIWIKDTDKRDNEHRLEQSMNVKKFLDQIQGKKILCGDFNLRPDTRSLAILEDGMRNLVKEYNVLSTRSSFYEKECKFADYILVSPDIKVKDFKALPVEVSDHLPLMVEFE